MRMLQQSLASTTSFVDGVRSSSVDAEHTSYTLTPDLTVIQLILRLISITFTDHQEIERSFRKWSLKIFVFAASSHRFSSHCTVLRQSFDRMSFHTDRRI